MSMDLQALLDQREKLNLTRLSRPKANLVQGRTDWYKITNKSNGVAEIMLYEEIGYFGVTASDFAKEIKDLDVSTIDLRINSPGGEVFEGIAILNSLRNHPAKKIVTVDGYACSAASFIAMAGDEIVMNKNSEMMIHDGLALCIGNASDMRETAELLDRVSDNIASIYAEASRGNKDKEHWRALMRAETWFTADEAVEAGLADRVVGGKEGSGQTSNGWDLSIFNYTGRQGAPAPAIPREEPSFAWDPDEIRRAFEEALR